MTRFLLRTPAEQPCTPCRATTADTRAYRGDYLHVEGIVRVENKGIGNHRIDIHLAPAGSGGRDAKPIGYAVSRPDGTFSATMDTSVPSGMDVSVQVMSMAPPKAGSSDATAR